MSDKAMPRRDVRGQALAAVLPSGFPTEIWWSAFADCGEWNARLHQATVAFSNEWQDFAARRMKEDLLLLQRLGSARSPDEVWAAYVGFWQKAAGDYVQETFRTLTLAGGLVDRDPAATHRQVEAARADTPPLGRAA